MYSYTNPEFDKCKKVDYYKVLKRRLSGFFSFVCYACSRLVELHIVSVRYLVCFIAIIIVMFGFFAFNSAYDKVDSTKEMVVSDKDVVKVSNSEPVREWVFPLDDGYYITSDYGYRWGKFHFGVDLSNTSGRGNIYASRSGVVETSSYDSTCGYYVIIKDDEYYTLYAHLRSFPNVSVGNNVNAGDVIGYMGSTGYSTGAHLHFSVCSDHPLNNSASCVDPLKFFW